MISRALIAPQGNSNKTETSSQSWYTIFNKNGVGVIEIIGDIGAWGITAKQFAKDLAALGNVKTLEATIHSGGGDVFDGMAIYNLLKGHKAHKSAKVLGLAASMASVILMAFDHVEIPANAMIMVHKPWGGTIGDADDMRKYADLLDKVEGTLLSAYESKTGLDRAKLEEMLAAETWLDGNEAKALGFANSVSEPLQMAAQLDSERLKDYNMPQALKQLFAPRGETLTPAAPTAPQAAVPAPQPAPQPAPAPAPDVNALAAQLVAQRTAGINAAFAAFPQMTELHNQCLSDPSCTVDQAKDKILAALGAVQTPAAGQHVHVHAGNGNIVSDSIRACVMARAGHQEHEASNNYRSYNLKELARASLTDRGIGIAGMNSLQMVGLAFTHSSSDFGNILLDVANKSVLQGWELAEETFEKWTRKGQLTDFKTATRVGLDEFGSLRQVRPGAEYKYVTLGDKGAKIALATFGEIFSITRQCIINDDMEMLTSIPMKMGMAAKGTIGDLVYAVLTSNAKAPDGKSIFHADHKNQATGAIDIANLDKARQLMRAHRSNADGKGRHLNIRPAFVLVPTALETTALQTIKSASVKGADANSGIVNPLQNFAEVIAEPRLDDDSATKWYLAAQKGSDTVEVAYLDGIDKPYIEQQEGFTIDGVATKVRIDAGVAPLDYRGLVLSSGQ